MFGNKKLKTLYLALAIVLAAPGAVRAQLTYTSLQYCTNPTTFGGHCTSYDLLTANYLVNCSYSIDNFDTNHYAALTDYDYLSAAGCGGCIRAVGPGATTVIVVDSCPY
jgi:hypothetical protein